MPIINRIKNFRYFKHVVIIALIGATVLLLSVPHIMNYYWIRTITLIIMYATMASSWNIMCGYTGYISFGHVAFFGIGAYTAAIMANSLQTHFIVNCLAGGLVATVFAYIVGLPVLKLKGHYFALVTFGVAEAVKGLVNNWTSLTGGGRGMSLPHLFPDIASNYTVFYYIFIVLLFITASVSYLIRRSRIGYALVAIREDEEGAASMGINTAKYKNIAFCYSAVFFGVVGGVYAYWLSYIDTLTVFSVHLSVNVILMTILGGAGTVFGPILGAFIFQGLSEVLRNNFLTTHSLLLGLLMIIVIMFVPKGFMDLFSGRRQFTWSMLLENVRWYKE